MRQFYAFSKFSLIFKWPKSEETSIGDFFQHHHVEEQIFFFTKKKRKKKNWFWGLRRVSVAIVTTIRVTLSMILTGCHSRTPGEKATLHTRWKDELVKECKNQNGQGKPGMHWQRKAWNKIKMESRRAGVCPKMGRNGTTQWCRRIYKRYVK